MNSESIWQKIVEFAEEFFNFAMTQGENNFMLVNSDFITGDGVPDDAGYFFIGSLIIMVFCSIFACDEFEILHPIEGIKNWKYKISIVKVVVFAAAVFSFHTFYKMLVDIGGGFIGADGSVRALDCLGSFINPISIMIYAFVVSTLTLRRIWFQAFMIGLTLFLTPSAMTFYGFTPEHIAIYLTAIVISIVGGILHVLYLKDKCKPFIACFVLYIVYFISKYFMIFYSEQVSLITAEDWAGKIKQYLACVEMDLIYALILLLVLFVYEVTTNENVSVKKIIVLPIILTVITGLSIFFGRTELRYQPDYEHAIALWETGQYQEALDAFTLIKRYKDSEEYIEKCITEINEPIYNQGLAYMEGGMYEEAYNLFMSIIDYKDSSTKVTECEPHMMYKLAGVWKGHDGTFIEIRADGTCSYRDSYTEGDGTWSVDENDTIHINVPVLSYEIYGSLDDTFRTTTVTIDSSSSSWTSETFNKIKNYEDPANIVLLSGEWISDEGSVLTIYEDGQCYFVNGSDGVESSGTWYIDNFAQIHVYLDVMEYEIYGLLIDGYETKELYMESESWAWSSITFNKQ